MINPRFTVEPVRGDELSDQIKAVFESAFGRPGAVLTGIQLRGTHTIAAQFKSPSGLVVEVRWILGSMQEIIG